MDKLQRIKSDGIEIAVEEFGQGEPFIFAHGLTGNRHGSRAQLEPLADRYRIIIYDQRGHCDSTPVTDPALYNAERMAEDMTAVMDTLGIPRAIVGGESMGATTTLLFALKHPERVKALLLTAPAFGDQLNPDRQRLKDLGKTIAKLGMDEFLKQAAVRQRNDLGWSPEVIAYVRDKFASHQAPSLAAAMQTAPEWVIFSDISVVSKLTCPTCIVAWKDDLLHPFELSQRIAALIPNARLEEIPTLPAAFADPPMVGKIYRRFLESA